MLRVIDDLLWSLRRAGFAVSTPQAIDVARVVGELGFDDRVELRRAIACIVVESSRDRVRYERTFDAFFGAADRAANDLWGRLRLQGFADEEIEMLRALLATVAGSDGAAGIELVATRAELDRVFSTGEIARALAGMTSPSQAGFFAERVLAASKLGHVMNAVAAVRQNLRDALGPERGEKLAAAFGAEVEDAASYVRETVVDLSRRRAGDDDDHERRLKTTPFASLSEAELEEVKRAVRRFAERLRGAARVRERHAKRGKPDPRRTLRRSVSTGGIPFRPARRRRRRDKPRLVLLCDVSDSVRTAARFMLELVYAVQELFDRTRSFVFVSDIGEVTRLFQNEQVDVALAKAYGGAIVDVNDNSSYGRALLAFEERHISAIDRRTTVVVLGDGRTNYRPDGADVLGRIRERAKAVLWLCPEARGAWGMSDSAMLRYAARVDRVLEVRTAADLERAARELVSRR